MKRITSSFALLLIATLLFAQGAAAQTAVVDKGGLKIYNEGSVLSQSDLDSISYVAADFPLPLTIFITNQYKGAKIDFSKQIAKLVTENNVVIGISTYKDNSVNYRYRLIGAGPKAGLSQSDLDGAQGVADKYLRDPNGPQYVSAISGMIGYLEATIKGSSGSSGNNGGMSSTTDSGSTTTPGAARKSDFWDLVIGLIIIALIIWLVFLFLRWIWRQFNRSNPAARPSSSGGGGGYYDGGPVYYPIWLGGGSYGNGGGSSSGGGGGSISAPSIPDNAGGGAFASNFGGGGGSTAGNSGGGGGAFASVFGKDSSSGSSSSSGGGGGSFVSAVGSSVATEAAANAAGAAAGIAINILGGILGAVFSSGSGGSGPDF